MPKIQIKSRFAESVIFESDAETVGDAVKAALAAKVNLSRADLSSANLASADLFDANLSHANLYRANLFDANLSHANLSRANLFDANLSSANLSHANLYRADLSRADLFGVNLSSADLKKVLTARTILPDGDLIGWKKLRGDVICKLRIPVSAKRVGGLIGRKCRAEFAEVLQGEGASIHDADFLYAIGQTVKPDKFDDNPLVECSHGIHFFITRQEAEDCNK